MLKKLWYRLPFTGAPKPRVMVLSLSGVISPEGRGTKALNLETVGKALTKAFDDDAAKAVVLSINSPGGAPAQARMIHDRVRQLAEEKKRPVLCYIEDVGASGGYMIALSGDEVFADPFAIVGSIGVISSGFGFQHAIEKLGIERRVYTAGTTKSQLDPFKPENEQDVARLQDLLGKSHELFKQMVRERRGGRLKEEEDVLFNGAFWIAQDATDLGLIDGVGDLRALLKERYGKDVELRKIDVEKKSLVAKLLGANGQNSISKDALHTFEQEAHWARFGS